MSKIYLIDELAEAVKIERKILGEWETNQLIRAFGHTDDNTPYFAEESIQECLTIKSLVDLGYNFEDIQKIKKKVGLPGSLGSDESPRTKQKLLTVGELAEKVGVSSRTLKHWEEKGIIESDMRSEGGFRLYSEQFVYLCSLVQDLQNFGYTLDEIKNVSDYFRDFLLLNTNYESFPKENVDAKLSLMMNEIESLFSKMEKLKQGINRWEELLKTKRKEIISIKNKNKKRPE